jgi:hypothetical protein
MRGQFVHKTEVATMAIGDTVTRAIPIDGVNRIGLELPTFAASLVTATANVFVKVCETETGTFRRVKDMGVYSASSGLQDWEVPSTVGGSMVLCRPVPGFNYMQIEMSKTATAAYYPTVHKIF